ncbi:hypothetical protein FIBSPDRAFT_968339 [Athelia psychrophila]|uniref:Uncharacterized protein n=1 Tax=Athelia psychrophila TaxID=1759441 RepID=A0A167UQT1_9AGAM|nr:hypothetical protein FIBSPDRAFT_968339 [Fibularhizoctonia sp. CBS 109695]
MMFSLLFALALITEVIAVKITTPNATTNWTSPGPNIIAWTTGSADPATFSIQLAQHNLASFAPNPALPADGIIGAALPASALTTVFVPSCVAPGARLPAGAGFTLRFLGENADGSMALLATSQVFNIAEAGVTQCADLASTTSTSTSGPTMSGASVSSAAPTGSGTAVVVSSGALSTSVNTVSFTPLAYPCFML